MPYIRLPDNSYYPVVEGKTPQEALEAARSKYPKAFMTEGEIESKQGFLPAAGDAFKRAKAGTYEAAGKLFGSDTLKQLAEKEQKELEEKPGFIPTTEEDRAAAFKKGLGSGIGALAREYISEPVGGIVGRYGVPLAVGAGASLAAPAVGLGAFGTAVAGGAATALADYLPQVGENLERQRTVKQPEDLQAAALTGIPQAALSGLNLRLGMLPKPIQNIFKADAAALEKKVLAGMDPKEAIAQLSGRLKNILLSTGSAAVVGAGTMGAEELLRRQQAGQSLTDDEAIQDYKDIGTGALAIAPLFGIPRGMGKRGAEKRGIESASQKYEVTRGREERARQDAEAAATADLAQAEEFRKRQGETGDLFGEQFRTEGPAKGKQAFGKMEGDVSPLPGVSDNLLPRERERMEQEQFVESKSPQEVMSQEENLRQYVSGLRDQVSAAAAKADIKMLSELTPKLKQAEVAYAAVSKEYAALDIPEVKFKQLTDQIETKTKQLQKAGDAQGDFATIEKLTNDIQKLQAELEKVKPQSGPDLFAVEKEQRIGEEIGKYEDEVGARNENQQRTAEQERKQKEDTERQERQKGLDETFASGTDDIIAKRLAEEASNAAAAKGQNRAEPIDVNALEERTQKLEDLRNKIAEEEYGYKAKETEQQQLKDAYEQSKLEKQTPAQRSALTRKIQKLTNEMGQIQENLWALKSEFARETHAAAGSRPDVRRNNALEAQKNALGDLQVALQDLAAVRGTNGAGKLTLMPQEGRAEAQRNRDEALTAISKYVSASIQEVNAIRDANKQKPLTQTEAIKLAVELRSWAERAVDSKNPDALKVGKGGVSPMQKQLAEIKSKFHKGESKLQRGPQGLRQEFDRVTGEEGVAGAGERLRLLEDKIQALEGQVNPDRQIIAQLKQAAAKERVLADKERAASETRERQGSKSADESVSTVRTERETQQAERQKEDQAARNARQDQLDLFKAKDLKPTSFIRATVNNFLRFLKSGFVSNLRSKLSPINGMEKEVSALLRNISKDLPANFKFTDSLERLKHIGDVIKKLEAQLEDVLYPETKIRAQIKAEQERLKNIEKEATVARDDIARLETAKQKLEKEKQETIGTPEFIDEITQKRLDAISNIDKKIEARKKELAKAEARLEELKEQYHPAFAVEELQQKLTDAKASEKARFAEFEKLDAEFAPRIEALKKLKLEAEEKLRQLEWKQLQEKISNAGDQTVKNKLLAEGERAREKADQQIDQTKRSMADRDARALNDARENLDKLGGIKQETIAGTRETPNKIALAKYKKLVAQRALEMGKEKPDAKRIQEIDTAIAQLETHFEAKAKTVKSVIEPTTEETRVEGQKATQKHAADDLLARKARSKEGLSVSAKKTELEASVARKARDAVRERITADNKKFAELQEKIDSATGKRKENLQKKLDDFTADVKKRDLVSEEKRLNDAYNEIAHQRGGMEAEAVAADQRKTTSTSAAKAAAADAKKQTDVLTKQEQKFDFNALLKEVLAEESGIPGAYAKQYGGRSGNDNRIAEFTGQRLDANESKRITDDIEKNLPKDIKVKSVESIADLPQEVKKGLALDGFIEGSAQANTLRGFVTPTGEVYIIRGNHATAKELQVTYAHEIIGHAGVDRILGPEGVRELVKRIQAHGGAMELAKKLGVEKEVQGAIHDQAMSLQKLIDSKASPEEIKKATEAMETQAVRELIAYTAEKRVDESFKQKAGRWLKELVGAVRAALRKMGFAELAGVSTSDIYQILRQSQRNFNRRELGAFREINGQMSYRNKAVYAEGFDAGMAAATGKIIAQQKGFRDRIKGSVTGMSMMTRMVDRFAPLDYIARTMKDKLEGVQMMYNNRVYDQRNNMLAEIATHGSVGYLKGADGSYQYKSRGGPSLKDVFETAAKSKNKVGNGQATTDFFGMYLAMERAASDKNGLAEGLNKLDFKGKVDITEAKRILDFGRNDKNFQEARKQYREYNGGLIDLMVETGRLSKEEAVALKSGDYVPYYRENAKGELWDTEHNIKIGDLKTQAYLKELIGGDSAIVNFETGALQNTYMLTDMAMSNIATKNTVFTLNKLGIADIRPGDGPAAPNVLRFYENGVQKHAVIETKGAYVAMEARLEKMREDGKANTPEYKKLRERAEASRMSETVYGDIPAELIVKGMEGVTTATPLVVAMMRGPANLLRKAITRNPVYAARVALKDSISGWITSGADVTPVLGVLGNLSKSWKGGSPEVRSLQSQGIIGGHVFSGTMSDMRTIAQQIAQGQTGWEKLWAKADRLAITADEASRVTLYNGFIKKGMSEMEATLATLESQNFTKHGFSPSMRMLSTMIPFFNAQITGLNTFISNLSGKSLFEDKLGVRATMLKRGAILAGTTMIYAALMQNNEAYKNASDQDRLNYWFVPLPFFDEPIRVPIPFESGTLFKAIPEALFNLAMSDAKAKDVLPAVAKLVLGTVPGMSNLGLPQGIKPIIEAATNTNLFTMSPIQSQRQLAKDAGQRANTNTTEASKMFGEALGVSPIMIDHFVNAYTSSAGIALLSMFNPALREVGSPESKTSQLPLIGGFFQPTDGSGLIDKAYNDMAQIERINTSFKEMAEQNPEKAEQYLEKNLQQIDLASAAGKFKKDMGELNKEERLIQSDRSMTREQKRKELDEIKQMKIEMAKEFMTISRE